MNTIGFLHSGWKGGSGGVLPNVEHDWVKKIM